MIHNQSYIFQICPQNYILLQMKTLIPLLMMLVLSNSITNVEKVDNVFFGIFQQNKLPKPQFCIQCVDDAIAKKFVLFIDDVLPRIAKLLPPFLALKKQITDFANTFEMSFIWCLGYSYEIQFLGQRYNIQAGSTIQDIQHYFIHYFEFHYAAAHKTLKEANDLWQKEKYFEFGVHMAQFVHKVIDSKKVTKFNNILKKK